jgi:hypothetical protein
MSMHEIEDLVESTVRLIAASAPASGLDLRTLFWNLYNYQSGFDTGNTLFRVAPILVKHRYLYALPLDSHPDFARMPAYFAAVRTKEGENVYLDPSRPWEETDNPVAGYYCDPVRRWGEPWCIENGWEAFLRQPLLYCEAGSPLWKRWVDNATLKGPDAEPPARVDRVRLFRVVIEEAVLQRKRELAAEWYQVGIPYELAWVNESELRSLKSDPDLNAIRALTVEHRLHAVPVVRGFMDMREADNEELLPFLAWWIPRDAEAARSVESSAADTKMHRAIEDAIARRVHGEPVEPVFLTPEGVTFDGATVRLFGMEIAGADPFTLRQINRDVLADRERVWRHTHLVPGADGSSFKVIGGVGGIYAKDANRVYVRDGGNYRPIEGADVKTFKGLKFGYARDARHVYCRATILEGVGDHFSIDDCGFLHGEDAVYHYDYRLPLDAASFRVLNLEDKLKETNPHLGEFRLADREGVYRYYVHGPRIEFGPIDC